MAPLQCTRPQDHRAKDYPTPSFPSLRKKARTYLWLISLLKQYSSAETSDCFSAAPGTLTKTVSVDSTRTQFCAEEVFTAACARATARAGSAAISWYRTCCSGTPKQAVSYIPGKVLQQSHPRFVSTSAVQTRCKQTRSGSLPPALYVPFLPMSPPPAKAPMEMSKPHPPEGGRAFKGKEGIQWKLQMCPA